MIMLSVLAANNIANGLLSDAHGAPWHDIQPPIAQTCDEMEEREGRSSRTVPLNPTAILQKYLFARFGSSPVVLDEPLFPSRFHGKRSNRCRANVIVHEVIKRADIENLGKGR